MYFAKVITMGSIMQINSAFGRVQDSLSTVISSFSSWASYKAVTDRLALFFDSMDSSLGILCLESKKGESSDFEVSKLNVNSPSGTNLWKNIDFKLAKGDSLLIRGPSGCGKSTLIKTFASIWPYAEGDVVIPKDANE